MEKVRKKKSVHIHWMEAAGRRRGLAPVRNRIVAGVDVGSSKICCLVARIDGRGNIGLLGMGKVASSGVEAGAIANVEKAAAAARQALAAAEKSATEAIERVYVNVTGSGINSQIVSASTVIEGQQIDIRDIRRLLTMADQESRDDGRHRYHRIPIGFTIDDNLQGIRDPRGMYANRLSVDIHLANGPATPAKAVETLLDACHLDIAGMVLPAYAAGYACLDEDERDLGATVVDIGGGTTTLAMFADGQLVHTDMIPLGGNHVTSDLAKWLSAPFSEAERIKVNFGSCVASPVDAAESFDFHRLAANGELIEDSLERSFLIGIVRPRMQEILEMLNERLRKSGFVEQAGRRVVFTGGGATISGLLTLARMATGASVRLGHPQGVRAMGDLAIGPEWAGCVGLLRYASKPPTELGTALVESDLSHERGRIGRIGRWLKEYFV